MKLWVTGVIDNFIECIPKDNKCSSCIVRFKCFTNRDFDHTGSPVNPYGGVRLTEDEFWEFMRMVSK